jgi:Arc/MetJ-type ribon-helix-helix transcriptional regulator
MKLAIRSDLEAYLRQQVKVGRYADFNQALNGALEVARDQETLTPEDLAHLRREVRLGLDAADRGEFSDFNANDIKVQGRSILGRRRTRSSKAGAKNGSGSKRRV